MSKRLEMFDKLLANGSSDPFHYYARAMELRSLGRTSEALDAFADVVARFPKYVPSYLMAAQVAREAGDVARSRELAGAGVEAARTAGDEHALSELSAFVDALPT